MLLAAFLPLLCVSFHLGESSKILGIFPSPGYSQFILAERLMTELANRGHEVTMISPFQPKRPVKNYNTILIDGILEAFNEMDSDLLSSLDKNIFINLFELYVSFGPGVTEYTLSEPKVQHLINSNTTFDLVIIEPFFNEAFAGFAHHFKAPLVFFSSIGGSEWVNFLVANPMPPSYVKHSGIGYAGVMNFWQRLKNLSLYLFEVTSRKFYFYPRQAELLKRYFPNAPDLQDVMYNVSLVLLNSHVSYTESVPLLPNMIEIAGFHVTEESLEGDLKRFLDDSKEGVVYFSLGTYLKSNGLPLEYKQIFINTFKQLPFKVLWKFEDEDLLGKPENVKIQKWLPQRAVLAHKNVKVFISHCGHISETEAVYFGVPLICIPFFVDQPTNAAVATKNGMAVTLNFRELSKIKIENALNEVIFQKKYSESAKLHSRLMHDRPMKPMDTAMYWIEYVLRHKNVQHLRSAGLKVKWYQYIYFDALIIFIVILIVLKKLLSKAGAILLNSKSKDKGALNKKKRN